MTVLQRSEPLAQPLSQPLTPSAPTVVRRRRGEQPVVRRRLLAGLDASLRAAGTGAGD